jgi:hypothetical protein
MFSAGPHDDQVDATSLAFNKLAALRTPCFIRCGDASFSLDDGRDPRRSPWSMAPWAAWKPLRPAAASWISPPRLRDGIDWAGDDE